MLKIKTFRTVLKVLLGGGCFFLGPGGGGGGVNKISHIQRHPCEFPNSDDQVPPDPSRSVDMMDKRWVSRVTTSWWALLFFVTGNLSFQSM